MRWVSSLQTPFVFLLRAGFYGSGFPSPVWMAFSSLANIPRTLPRHKVCGTRCAPCVTSVLLCRQGQPAPGTPSSPSLTDVLRVGEPSVCLNRLARVKPLAHGGICSICKGQEEERALPLPPGSAYFSLCFIFFLFFSSTHQHQPALCKPSQFCREALQLEMRTALLHPPLCLLLQGSGWSQLDFGGQGAWHVAPIEQALGLVWFHFGVPGWEPGTPTSPGRTRGTGLLLLCQHSAPPRNKMPVVLGLPSQE